jgi:hypothetical protein
MLSNEEKKIFIDKYSSLGEEKFYKFLLKYAMDKITTNNNGISPELELIDYYEKFVDVYRQENLDIYLCIAKLFRRAAHRIYYVLLDINPSVKNDKFLNLV